jgi:Leucine-rich repeat (LRR) protein
LFRLDVSYNSFNSTIPTEIGLLTNLYHVDAMGNQLRGSLPDEMLNMNRNLRLNFTDNL